MRFGNGAVYSKTYLEDTMLVNKELTIYANII
jgi:hypothetical protein